jgi:hypothetical protein
MEKIYDLVNRENGVSTRCSEKYIFQWLARGYEVESFVFDEPPKTFYEFNILLLQLGLLTNFNYSSPHSYLYFLVS